MLFLGDYDFLTIFAMFWETRKIEKITWEVVFSYETGNWRVLDFLKEN